MKKRIFAILMSCALCLALLPPAALAEGDPEGAEPAVPEAVVPAADGLDDDLTAYDPDTGDTWNEYDVEPGGDVLLRVEAEAADLSGVTYAWYRSTFNAAGNQTSYSLVEGQTGASLAIQNVTEEALYTCEVSDGRGNTAYVYYELHLDTGLRVRIKGLDYDSDWAELRYEKDTRPVLEVEASGSGPFAYAWFGYERLYDEDFSYWKMVDEVLGTGASFTAPPVTGPARYACVVTDSFGATAAADFELAVENHFEAYADPSVVTAPLGADAVLRVTAVSDDDITYQWYTAKDSGYGWVEEDEPIDGAVGAELTVKAEQNAEYICNVTSGGETSSITVSLEIDNGFTACPKGIEDYAADIYTKEGTTALLEVEAHANNGALTYRWYHSELLGEDWPEDVLIEGQNGPSLTTVPIRQAESYSCVVTDKFGSVREVYFNVYVDDGFTLVPAGSYTKVAEPHVPGVWSEFGVDVYYVYAKPGDTVTLGGTAASGSGKPIEYSWACLTDPWFGTLEGETADTLVLKAAGEDRHYVMVAENAYGEYLNLYFKVVVSGDGPVYDPLDKNRDGSVDILDAAAFLAAKEPEGAVQVLQRILDLG